MNVVEETSSPIERETSKHSNQSRERGKMLNRDTNLSQVWEAKQPDRFRSNPAGYGRADA